MEIRLFPNMIRPGVGQKPRRESQRPLLPQHSRHCPVLEAGSSAGYLVYPPLEPQESYYIDYQGDGRYRFVYYVSPPTSGGWEPIFAVTMTMSVGGIGMFREDVSFLTRVPLFTRENALLLARSFFVPEDLGTPPGALSLRGAWNFQTPQGWDTLYTPVFNMIERPVAPMLVIRVESDWYAHETEFRYVLQPGEGVSGSHSIPIGQVMFVPREEFSMRACTDEELAAIRQSQVEFSREKAASKMNTAYGLSYSPHYLRQSRAQRTTERPGDVTPVQGVVAMHEDPHVAAKAADRVGRNDPCPCGSGKKYKKCHGMAAGG